MECRVTDIPDTLHPIVTDLGLGETLLVKDLELPSGVETITDPNERVATVRELAALVEEETPESEGKTEEPERIGRVRKEEEPKAKGEAKPKP